MHVDYQESDPESERSEHEGFEKSDDKEDTFESCVEENEFEKGDEKEGDEFERYDDKMMMGVEGTLYVNFKHM